MLSEDSTVGTKASIFIKKVFSLFFKDFLLLEVLKFERVEASA